MTNWALFAGSPARFLKLPTADPIGQSFPITPERISLAFILSTLPPGLQGAEARITSPPPMAEPTGKYIPALKEEDAGTISAFQMKTTAGCVVTLAG